MSSRQTPLAMCLTPALPQPPPPPPHSPTAQQAALQLRVMKPRTQQVARQRVVLQSLQAAWLSGELLPQQLASLQQPWHAM